MNGGELPWMNAEYEEEEGMTEEELQELKQKMILRLKKRATFESLFKGFAPEFITYMYYCRNLKFDEDPDYAYITSLFKKVMKDRGGGKEHEYDWFHKRQELLKIYEPTLAKNHPNLN
jgi:hypothetical protein